MTACGRRDPVDQALLAATVRCSGPGARIAELAVSRPTRWSATTTERLLTTG